MRSIILGHKGLVGSALHRLIPDAIIFPRGLDLRDNGHTQAMFRAMVGGYGQIETVYLAAAKVGGIKANITKPAEFLFDNLAIAMNVVAACREFGVGLLVMLGSSCIYPRVKSIAPEEGWLEADLMDGRLEPTNEPYAIAKLAGIKLLEASGRQFGQQGLTVMPCNLYGPGDNFNPESSHFLPAMIRKFYDAKRNGAGEVQLWGTGRPRRELMHVDDLARITVALVQQGARGLINVGPGVDFSIEEYAKLVRFAADFDDCKISFDHTKPDGVERKLLNVDRMRARGLSPRISLVTGIAQTYAWYKEREG